VSDQQEPSLVTLDSLANEVKNLQKQIDKETKGFTGRIKWLGTILAFVAAIFAVPKGALDLYDKVHSRPHTQLTPESALLLSYDPKTKLISFSSDFTISNTGERLDTIQNMRATLQRIDYTSDLSLSFEDTNFAVFENSAKITNRFPINKDSTRSLAYVTSRYLSDDNRLSIFQPKSQWRLDLEFTGEFQSKYPIKYCFDVSQGIADELIAAKDTVSKRLLNPWCDH
jgi:hypothetical protein